MKLSFISVIICVFVFNTATANNNEPRFFPANNINIQYTGRIDFSDPLKPRFWAPGVYISAKFKGSSCTFIINDEVLYGNNHNYIEVVIDDKKLVRIQTKNKTDTINAAHDLPDGEHRITICKDTESGIGYLEFIGFTCEDILPSPALPSRKIEFIGNSITCGSGSDLSEIPCGKGLWYDQHNAYLSYGPTTARALHAQWQLSAVSGIGLIHSCCKMEIAMPQVFDKINMRSDSIQWDFTNYQADVVTICLGQNDGILDSALFCGTYVQFIKKIRSYYPAATIICLTSPMGDEKLTAALKNYINGIISVMHDREKDKKIYKFFFTKRFNHGCGDHPDLAEHQEIAKELSAHIKEIMKW
jgi:carbohydrate esterase-like protein/GDSL-like lipase/acylhydrolase family protein